MITKLCLELNRLWYRQETDFKFKKSSHPEVTKIRGKIFVLSHLPIVEVYMQVDWVSKLRDCIDGQVC